MEIERSYKSILLAQIFAVFLVVTCQNQSIFSLHHRLKPKVLKTFLVKWSRRMRNLQNGQQKQAQKVQAGTTTTILKEYRSVHKISEFNRKFQIKELLAVQQ